MRRPTLLFGVPVDDVSMDETLSMIGELVADGRASGRTHQIATVNVDFLVNAIDHSDLRTLLQHSALNLADGVPVLWGARLAGLPVRERVAGSDLVPLLVRDAEHTGWHVHLFGAQPDVMSSALTRLRRRYPNAKVTGESGPIISDVTNVDPAVIENLARQKADVVCVALGHPKQERFIAEHREALGAPVMIGIGGSLDMLVGRRKRAPDWIQRVGAEWLFRAAQEPGRLGRRYARDALVFLPQLVRYLRLLQMIRSGPDVRGEFVSDAALHIRSGSPADSSLDVEEVVDLIEREETIDAISLAFDAGVPHPSALAETLGLLRAAQRRGLRRSVVPLGAESRRTFDRLGLASWILSLDREEP